MVARKWRSISEVGTTEPFFLQVARGQITGHDPVFKYGSNKALPTAFQTLWTQGVQYPWPASARTLTISSDDAEDGVAGDGALTVVVEGLDANYNFVSQTLIMDGVDEVAVPIDLIRPNRMYVKTAGSNLTNVGNIYIGTGTVTIGVPAVIYGEIDGTDDEGQSLMCLYTIPADHTGYLLSAHVHGGRKANSNIEARIRFRPFGGAWRTLDTFPIYQGNNQDKPVVPILFTEKTDIEIQARAEAVMQVSASFEILSISDIEVT